MAGQLPYSWRNLVCFISGALLLSCSSGRPKSKPAEDDPAAPTSSVGSSVSSSSKTSDTLSDSDVVAEDESESTEATSTTSVTTTTAAAAVPAINDGLALVAQPASVVSFGGSHIDATIKVHIESNEIAITVISSTEGSFIMPAVRAGLVDVVFKVGTTVIKTLSIISDSANDGVPIYIGAADQFCSNESYRNAAGDVVNGTMNCGSAPADCGGDGLIGCLAIAAYPAADMSRAVAGNILSGQTLAGVSGSATPRPANCNGNFQTNCVTTNDYQSASPTNFTAANLKNGVSIAGLTGTYPSSGNLLTGADSNVADLDGATFNSKLKMATSFEWFAPDGTRMTASGDADLNDAANIKLNTSIFGTVGTYAALSASDAWNFRAGSTVGGISGVMKANCRNGIGDNTVFNYDGSIASIGNTAQTGGSSLDYWDTIDDSHNGGAILTSYPNANVGGGTWNSANYCTGIDTQSASDDDTNIWKDISVQTTDTTVIQACGASSDCVYKDQITQLWWSKSHGTGTWAGAVRTCDALNFAGKSDWRLPTQKELMAAYAHGIRNAATTNWLATTDFSLTVPYLSATTLSTNQGRAIQVNLYSGAVVQSTASWKDSSPYRIVCVR